MKSIPDDPMRQHQRFMSAFIDDLWDNMLKGTKGSPRANAVCEISRQLAEAADPRKERQ